MTILGRLDADGHRFPIALANEYVGDVHLLELRLELEEMVLVPSVESYRNGVRWNTRRRRFPSSMNRLSDLRPKGEVSSDDDVVDEVRVDVRSFAALRGAGFNRVVNA